MTTEVYITENVTDIAIGDDQAATEITVQENKTEVTVSAALSATAGANAIVYEAGGSIESTTVQAAIEELANDFYRGTTVPTSGIEEGDLFYDTDDNILRVYAETSSNNLEWVTLMEATDSTNMLRLDGGSYQNPK